MFSSNQIMKISADKEQLESVVLFAIKMSENKGNFCYQVVDGNRFALGYYYDKPPVGWSAFPTSTPSVKTIASTIEDVVKYPQGFSGTYYGDGTYQEGYLLSCGSGCMAEVEETGVMNPMYCIFVVDFFQNYYAK